VSTTSDPLATRGLIARGIGVGWVPSLLTDEYSGVTIRPVSDPMLRRDIYALLPSGEHHPLAKPVIDALIETAAELRRGGGDCPLYGRLDKTQAAGTATLTGVGNTAGGIAMRLVLRPGGAARMPSAHSDFL
jgi:hypothetical protein